MNDRVFEEILNRRIEETRKTLSVKAKEYAVDADRLHNFNVAASFLGVTPTQACFGFAMKHLTSVRDMVQSGTPQPRERWDEKLGDLVNYLILLEATTYETPEETRAPWGVK